MRDTLAEHVFIHVRMRIHMHHRHRAVLGGHGPQNRQCNGVVTAQGERYAAMAQHIGVVGGDDVYRLEQRVSVDGHIAQIRHLQDIKWSGAGGHVVGAQQTGLGTDLARAEARTRAVAGAYVQWYTDEGGIQPLGGCGDRQAHHAGDAAEARHGIAGERLVQIHRDRVQGQALRPRSHSSTSNMVVVNRISKVATAAIVGEMFSRIPVNIWRGRVVCSAPARNRVTPTSSNEVAKANSAPEISPGAITGGVTRMKVLNGVSHRLSEARTRLWLKLASVASTVVSTKGAPMAACTAIRPT